MSAGVVERRWEDTDYHLLVSSDPETEGAGLLRFADIWDPDQQSRAEFVAGFEAQACALADGSSVTAAVEARERAVRKTKEPPPPASEQDDEADAGSAQRGRRPKAKD